MFVSGLPSITSRGCGSRSSYDRGGCHSGSFFSLSGTVCACYTDLCNAAAMTSSVGHVVVVVALFINVVIGYLL